MLSFRNLLTNLWPAKIRGRLILGIASIQLALMTAFVVYLVNHQRQFLMRQNEQQTFSFVNDYAVNSTPYVMANDFDELERLTISHINFPNLKYAMILTPDGVVLAHTNTNYVGTRLSDSVSLQLKGAKTGKKLVENEHIIDVAVPVIIDGKMAGWARVGVGQDYIQANMTSIFRKGALYIIIGLLLSTLFALFIAGRLTRGLYKLIRTADSIKEGDRKIRAPVLETFELSQLGTAFNQMLDDISANEYLLRLVIESMPVGVWIFNEKNEIISGNSSGKQLWEGSKSVGTKGPAIYRAWRSDTKELIQPNEWASSRAIDNDETTVNEEIEIELFNGKRKSILNSAIPLKGKDDKIIGAIAINVDITERKKITEQLALSESTLSSAFEYSAIGMTLVSPAGKFIRVNKSLCNLLGYSEKELLTLTFQDITHPDDLKADLYLVNKTLGGAIDSYRMEKRYFDKNGNIIWIHLSVSLVRDKQNQPLFFISQIEDITERKKIVEQLSLSESTLSSAFDNSAIGMALVSPTGMFLKVNKQLSRILGYKEQELLSLSFQQLTYSDDLDEDLTYLQQTLRGEIDSFQMEKRYVNKGGNIIWAHLSVSLVRDSKGLPLFLVSQIEDISERKKSEAIILHEKNLSDSMINGMPGIFYLSDKEGRLLRWNSNLEAITGYNHWEISKMRNLEFFDEAQVDYVISKRKEAFSTGKASAEVEIITKQGQKLNYYVIIIPITYNDQDCILGMGIDFTEKKKSELTLVQKNREIQDRVREIRCLYRVTEMANEKSLSIDQVIRETASSIPGAYPADLQVSTKISLGLRSFESAEFIETEQKHEVPIIVRGQSIGSVTVYDSKNQEGHEKKIFQEMIPFIESVASILSNAIEARAGEIELRNMAEEFRAIIENTNESILLLNIDYSVLRFNKTASERLSFRNNKQIYIGADFRDFLYPDSREAFCRLFNEVLNGKPIDVENQRKDIYGNSFWLRSRLFPVYDEANCVSSVTLLAEDITEKKKTEQAILQFSRLYQFTSSINDIMLHAENKDAIFSEACQVAVAKGQFALAWIGNFSETDEGLEIFAKSGIDNGYLEVLRSKIDKNEFKIGSFANAIHQKKPICYNDIAGESFSESWKEEMLKRNFRSIISLPIIIGTRLEAVFTLYRSQALFFNDEEIKLLQEVTNNIAYAIEKLELKDLQKRSEEHLRESEEQFRKLVEETLVGVFILQEGNYVYVNPQFERISGYSKTELLNEISFRQLIHEEDLKTIMKNDSTQTEAGNQSHHYTLRGIRNGGVIVPIEMIISPISYKSRPAIIGTIIDITEQVEEEKRINRAVTEAQEIERQQISMELHDNVKQIVAASLLNVDFMKMLLKDEQTIAPIIDNIRNYMRGAIEELRKISHQLAPSVDNAISLQEKIRTLVNTMNISNNLLVNYHFEDSDANFDADIQLAIYRILQEQFTNILKHSKASVVDVTVERRNGDIRLAIKDNGIGFDQMVTQAGIGLENIKRRVQVHNGSYLVQTAPGKGCNLEVNIPLN